MKFVFKNNILFLIILLLLASCDSGNNRRIETMEKEFVKDSNISATSKSKRKLHESKDILVGTWLKPKVSQKSDEGFSFEKDYNFNLINNFTSIGDTWELKSDTIITWTHTDMYPDPEETKYLIIELNDSVMVLSSVDSSKKYREIFRKQK